MAERVRQAWRGWRGWAGLACALVVMLAGGGGCAVRYVDYTTFAAEPGPIEVAERYRIGVPDELLIRSGAAEGVNGVRVTVQADGMIEVPGLGEIVAAGQTRDEVAMAVARRLDEHFADPAIEVVVERYASQQVHVSGRVAAPGPQPFDGRNTVISTLAQAKPTVEGDPRRILVLSPRGEGEYEPRARVDLQALDRGVAGASDVTLRPGEVVYVPAHPLTARREGLTDGEPSWDAKEWTVEEFSAAQW